FMMYRWSLFLIFFISPSFLCFSSQDWGARFSNERKLAMKKAGPSQFIFQQASPPSGKSVENISVPLPERKITKKKHKRVSKKRKESRHGEELVAKARLARENGQLEQALRLYKLAGRVNP